jgi:hypothetical protein
MESEKVYVEEKPNNLFKRVYHSLHKPKGHIVVDEGAFIDATAQVNQDKIRQQRKSTVPRRSGTR